MKAGSKIPVRRRNLRVSYGDYNDAGRFFLPLIRLHGIYLKKFGFEVGDVIEVAVNKGQITIKKVSHDLV